MPGYKTVLANLRPSGMGRRRKRVRKAPKMSMSMVPVMGGRRRRAPRRMGRGFLDTLKSGFNAAKGFVKDNRLLSRGIRMIPGKYSDVAAQAAELAGYGRKRPRVGGRVMFPAVYTTGLGGMAATI